MDSIKAGVVRVVDAVTSGKAALVAAMVAVTFLGEVADWVQWQVSGADTSAQLGKELREYGDSLSALREVIESERWDLIDSLGARFNAYDSAARAQRSRRAEDDSERTLELQRLNYRVCQALGIPASECM